MADDKVTQLSTAGTVQDTDLVPLVQNVSTVPVTNKLAWSALKTAIKTYTDTLYSVLGHTHDYQPIDGWVAAGETWTYASADSPTFTFTISGDKTTKYSAGMRIKLTQTTAKYFIVTKVEYSAPNTTVTVYGGTDYTLANATITSPYYSPDKAPYGFPLSPAKWTVTFSDTTDVSQASPTNNTWYNLGSLSFSVPIGVWALRSSLYLEGTAGAGTTITIFATLSTANNSESDTSLTSGGLVASNTSLRVAVERAKTLTVTAKTTYYILAVSRASSISSITIKGTLSASTVELVCAYL